jgi:nitroreductase
MKFMEPVIRSNIRPSGNECRCLTEATMAAATPLAKSQAFTFGARLFRPIVKLISHVCRLPRSVYQYFIFRAQQIAATSGLLAKCYYNFCSDSFRREQQALLAGFRSYAQSIREAEGESITLLRRNTHRLEKGLLMRPRREVFATEYIAETVACFEKALHIRGGGAIELGEELQWCRDVLAQYFELAGEHPTIDLARRRFNQLDASRNGVLPQLVPYERDLQQPLAIGINDLMTLAKRRRSVRWFLDRPVPRELIDRALEVAAQSPSACNRQPFVFHVFDDPKLVEKAAAIPMGTASFAHNIPVFVVIVGQQRHFFDERDRHLIYIDASLAAMSFVYALEVQGLSSCCINWPDIEEREQRMASLLNLEADERPIMCIALGYPDPTGLVAYSQKKLLSQLRQYNLG